MRDVGDPITPPVLRVLLIEDNEGDARLVAAMLAEDGDVRFELARETDLAGALRRAGFDHFDVVLADLGLPDSQGAATVTALLSTWATTPVVVMTGLPDRRQGTAAVQKGCQDYLVKGFTDPALLQRTLCYAIERSAAARVLQEGEMRFRRLVEVFPDAIILCSGDMVSFANHRATAIFRAEPEQSMLGMSVRALFHPADLPRMSVLLQSLRAEAPLVDALRQECRMARRDGSDFEASVTLAPMWNRDHYTLQMIVRDISGERAAERRSHLASVVFETTAEAIMVTDERNRIIAVNPAFERVTGYRPLEVIGRNPQYLSSGRHDAAFYARMWEALTIDGHWHGDVWNRRKDGEIYVQRLALSLIRSADGAVVNHVGVFSDITDETQEAELIRYRANYDALTGLPNRSLLHDRLLQALANTERELSQLAVLFLDIDGFKPVNDRFGHLAGDQLLVALSERLCDCVRESDTVARLAGDEFVVVLPNIAHRGDAEAIALKILALLDEPFRMEGESVPIGVSIGIALYPLHGHNAAQLLEAADHAMYRAKQHGKGCFAFMGDVGRTRDGRRSAP